MKAPSVELLWVWHTAAYTWRCKVNVHAIKRMNINKLWDEVLLTVGIHLFKICICILRLSRESHRCIYDSRSITCSLEIHAYKLCMHSAQSSTADGDFSQTTVDLSQKLATWRFHSTNTEVTVQCDSGHMTNITHPRMQLLLLCALPLWLWTDLFLSPSFDTYLKVIH